MRRLCYNVAMSLDGYLARPDGSYDWIVEDPTIDFEALFDRFGLFLMGRKTYEVMVAQGLESLLRRAPVAVVSHTLETPEITILREGVAEAVAELKRQPGKDIWLFGGGELFGALLDAGLVDTVEVAVMPVLLGEGIPLLKPGAVTRRLTRTSCEALASGIVLLTYMVENG
jgi:dihydrofolate reductase